jgi:hypothetical protein
MTGTGRPLPYLRSSRTVSVYTLWSGLMAQSTQMNLAQKTGVPEKACNVTLTIIRKHLAPVTQVKERSTATHDQTGSSHLADCGVSTLCSA